MNSITKLHRGRLIKITLVTCTFIFLIAGCGQPVLKKAENEPVPALLIEGLQSYQSVASAKDILIDCGRAVQWEVVEDKHQARQNRNFDNYSARVRPYVHLGHTGQLLLVFFNNQLMETRFYPNEYNAYFTDLSQCYSFELSGKRQLIRKHVCVWIETDFQGKRYFGCADTRLRDDYAKWIRTYS